MRAVAAIIRKELRVAFTTPVAYAVFTVFAIVSGFFFLRILNNFQRSVVLNTQMRPQLLQYMNFTDQVLSPLFFNAAVVLVFVVPFLTMRLLAEERHSRSYELLMTTPVTPWQIALGKYLSALVLVAVLVCMLLLFPALVSLFAEVGRVSWETVWTSLLGTLLLGAAFTAIGLFISALTQSQVVAAAITFCALLLLWVVGWAASDNAGLTREALAGLSAIEHMRGFVRGLIDMKDLVYYLTWVVLGLFLTARVLETQRWR